MRGFHLLNLTNDTKGSVADDADKDIKVIFAGFKIQNDQRDASICLDLRNQIVEGSKSLLGETTMLTEANDMEERQVQLRG